MTPDIHVKGQYTRNIRYASKHNFVLISLILLSITLYKWSIFAIIIGWYVALAPPSRKNMQENKQCWFKVQ